MKKEQARRLAERRRQLLGLIPGILHAPSLLYIGANRKRMEMLDLFFFNGCAIDVLEAWPENVAGLVRWNITERALSSIVQGDVLGLSASRLYDTVMWWHGPEHVPASRFDEALMRVERAASRLVVLACPWGNVPQGDAYGNPYERHHFGALPEDFTSRGYLVNCIGEKDALGSNLLAWKKVAA